MMYRNLSEQYALLMVKYRHQLLIVFTCVLALLLLLALLTFIRWGPTFSPDTLTYIRLAKKIGEGMFPYSGSYSPGYPASIFLLHLLANISFSKCCYVLCVVCFGATWILLYHAIKKLLGLERERWLLILVSGLLLNTWWSLNILFRAHADGLFYVFHVAILFTLLQFVRSRNTAWFILCSGLACVSVWVKYNGLIYLPYLAIVPVLVWGWRKIAFISIVPVLLVGGSFLLFRRINGSVIRHLEVSDRSFSLWQNEQSGQTLLTNLSDGGNVLFSSLTTNSQAVLLPASVSILVFVVVLAWLSFYVIKHIGKQNISAVMFAYTLIYMVGYLLMSQLTNHEEVKIRTMFPAILSFLFGMLMYVIRNPRPVWYLCIGLFAIFQPLRSVIGLADRYQNMSQPTFVAAQQFQHQPSLVRLNALMKERGYGTEDIYTNIGMYLTIYFDYRQVKSVPSRKLFSRGRPRDIPDKEFNQHMMDLQSKVDSGSAIIILFDDPWEGIEAFNAEQFRKEKIDNDVIIYAD